MDKKYIVESSFYSPSFDGAIFDGPFRLYFCQYQEQQALELYNQLNTTFKSYNKEIRNNYREEKKFIFLLMYPTLAEKQLRQPKGDSHKIFITPYLTNYIVGFNMNSLTSNIQELESYLGFICSNWFKGETSVIENNFKQDFLLHLS